MTQGPRSRREGGLTLSFQTRLTVTIVAASIVPLGIFGVLLLISGSVDPAIGTRFLLFMFAISVIVGVIGGAAVARDLEAPLREISTAVSRVSAGDMSQPIPVTGNDVLAHLAESHNRLASDASRRNQQLALILAAVESAEPRDGIDAMATRAAHDAGGRVRLHLCGGALRRPRYRGGRGADPRRLRADPGRARAGSRPAWFRHGRPREPT